MSSSPKRVTRATAGHPSASGGSIPTHTLHLQGCGHDAAAYACKNWHYSRSIPAGKLVKIGVWEDGKFVGCVIFGRGANNNLGKKYGLEQVEICELVRIALKAHKAPVSKIAALALRQLRKCSPGLRLVISYADPCQGHHGGIYQAGNWLYTGRSQEQRELKIDGREVHKRSAHSRYGTASPERLRARGLNVTYGESRSKHTYLMPLDDEMRAKVAPLRQPYPKRGTDDGSTRAAADADCDQADNGEPRQSPAE